jgi:5-methylcytosine-specific restriction endonuclease McrA
MAPMVSASARRGGVMTKRPSQAARGYDSEWRKMRLEFLKRHPRCMLCAKYDVRRPATVVDHIRPHRGDMQLFRAPNNLQALCASCHSSWKQSIERGGKPRGPKGCGEDGWSYWRNGK